MIKRTADSAALTEEMPPVSKRQFMNNDQTDNGAASTSLLLQRVEQFLPRIKQSGLSLGTRPITIDPDIVENEENEEEELRAPLIQEYEESEVDDDDESIASDDDDDLSELQSVDGILEDEDDEDLLSTDDEIEHEKEVSSDDSDEEDEVHFQEPIYVLESGRSTNAFEDQQPHVEMNIGIGMFDVGNDSFDFDNSNNHISIPSHLIAATETAAGKVGGESVGNGLLLAQISNDNQEESFSWLLQRNLDEDDI